MTTLRKLYLQRAGLLVDAALSATQSMKKDQYTFSSIGGILVDRGPRTRLEYVAPHLLCNSGAVTFFLMADRPSTKGPFVIGFSYMYPYMLTFNYSLKTGEITQSKVDGCLIAQYFKSDGLDKYELLNQWLGCFHIGLAGLDEAKIWPTCHPAPGS